MILNIIGNGFDLYHGLPSSYYYFGCYLIKKNPEFYEEFARIYDFRWARMNGYPFEDVKNYLVEDDFWSEFEKKLGNINEDFIIDTHIDDLGLENDDPVDIEMDEYLVVNTIKKYFVNWVLDTLEKKKIMI